MDIRATSLEVKALRFPIGCQCLEGVIIGLLIGFGLRLLLRSPVGITTRELC